MKLKCAICGKAFTTQKEKGRLPKYCSDECRRENRRKYHRDYYKKNRRRPHICQTCGKLFFPISSEKICPHCREQRQREVAEAKKKTKKRIKTCQVCGKEFEPYGNQIYCSRDCYNIMYHKYLSPHTCPICGKKFFAKKNQTYCSKDCRKLATNIRRMELYIQRKEQGQDRQTGPGRPSTYRIPILEETVYDQDLKPVWSHIRKQDWTIPRHDAPNQQIINAFQELVSGIGLTGCKQIKIYTGGTVLQTTTPRGEYSTQEALNEIRYWYARLPQQYQRYITKIEIYGYDDTAAEIRKGYAYGLKSYKKGAMNEAV